MSLTEAQKKACLELIELLSLEENVLAAADDVSLFVDGEALDEEKDDAWADDDEARLDMEENEKCDDNPVITSLPDLEALSGTPLQKAIASLLKALFTHLPDGGDDKFYTPITRFLVLSSMRRCGQWLSPKRITQTGTALLFCGRQVMMLIMTDAIATGSAQRYSESVTIS
jgi:hypothetical protein